MLEKKLADRIEEEAEKEGAAVVALKRHEKIMRWGLGTRVPKRRPKKQPGWRRFKVKYHL